MNDQTPNEGAPATLAAPSRPIETASATTSPDNANSGSKPIVIAAAGLLAAMIVFSSIAGGIAQLVSLAYVAYSNSTDAQGGVDPYYYLDGDGGDQLERLVEGDGNAHDGIQGGIDWYM